MSSTREGEQHIDTIENHENQWLHGALDLQKDQTPFPWQIRLLRHFLKGEVVPALDIPTGLGKTATIAIWLVARALGAVLPRKRACSSLHQEEIAMERVLANMGSSGPVFTREEHEANTREDARRLYPRVRHAARQLEHSIRKAARRLQLPASFVSRILFLDLDGNRSLINILERIHDWMKLPWAGSIDLVLFFDFGCRDNVWGTIAQAIYSRSDRTLEALYRALPHCSRRHFHVGNLPAGPCEFALPL